MVSPSFRSPAPSHLLDAVRAVFEHSGFVVSQGFDRPVGTDYVVHPSGKESERCAVACFAESAAADAVSQVADAAHQAGIRHVQVITTAPIPEDTIRTAQSARVALTDAKGFEAAVQALPEVVRQRLSSGQTPVPPPPPSYASALYGSGTVPIATPERPARKGPSLAFLMIMGVLLMVGVVVSIHSITSQMRLRQERAMRSARDLVQVAGNAKTAGHDFVEMTPEKTAKAVAESIARGATITDEASPLLGVTFSAGQMTAMQVEDAIPYLALEHGELVYKSPEPKPAVKAAPPAPPAPQPAVTAGSTSRPVSLTPLVVQRAFATLPISSSTPTWKSQCQRSMTDFYREVWSLGSITEHEALMFAGAQVDYHSSQVGDPQHPMLKDTLSQILSKYGSQYPQLTIASARYLDPEAYPELAEAALQQLSQDPNLPVLEWQARSQIAAMRRTKEDVTKAMEALHLMLDHTQGLTSVPDYLAANLLMDSEFGVFIFAMEHERIAGVVWDHPLTPAWLKEFVIGHHHAHAVAALGLQSDGNFTPAQALEARGHLSRGLAALKASWEENPNLPETAAAIITLSNLALKPRTESRQWFERAVRLRADCAAAYDNWLAVAKSDANFLRDFGDACFASKRFDTGIPQYYFDTHYFRSLLLPEPASYWANLPQEDMARMDEMFSGWKADVNRITTRDHDLTVEAIYHLKRGDVQSLLEAAAGLEKLDDDALRRYDMTLEKFMAAAGELRRGKSSPDSRVQSAPAKQVPVP